MRKKKRKKLKVPPANYQRAKKQGKTNYSPFWAKPHKRSTPIPPVDYGEAKKQGKTFFSRFWIK
jgi:hypothetical protein